MGRRAARWRRWNRAIHRDLGYVCVGLTLVYAVSGVAVNHMRDWNPNYRVSRETLALSPVPPAATPTEITEHVVRELGLGETARGTFRVDSATVDIFFHDASVRVDLLRNEVTLERVQERRLLRAFNLLHLNEPRGLWTYAADLFAVALILLAVSGLFMMKGRYGITGRGAWLTGAGLLLPLAALYFLG